MKNPYEILGLNSETPFDELKAKYNELKAKYSEDRFLTGAPGNEAARKLSELEVAWTEITANQEKSKTRRIYGNDFGSIDNLIKEGRYDDAQNTLDSMIDRTAEWHYLQSIIYYKREWMSESRSQLQMAVNMEPWNDKYKTALEKLNLVMGSAKTDPNTIGTPVGHQPMGEANACNTCSNCCFAACLADCCCSMTNCC